MSQITVEQEISYDEILFFLGLGKVWFKTFRLRDLCCHGYNKKRMVKVKEQ